MSGRRVSRGLRQGVSSPIYHVNHPLLLITYSRITFSAISCTSHFTYIHLYMPKKMEVSREETVISRKTVNIEVDSSYGQIAHNLLKGMVKVNSTWSFKFMLWIMGTLPYTETLLFTASVIKDFQESIGRLGGLPPSYRTMQWVLSEMIEAGLLQRTKGGYKLEASVFWQEATGKMTEDSNGSLQNHSEGGEDRQGFISKYSGAPGS